MAQMTWRTSAELLERVWQQPQQDGRSLNEWVTTVLAAGPASPRPARPPGAVFRCPSWSPRAAVDGVRGLSFGARALVWDVTFEVPAKVSSLKLASDPPRG